MAIHVINISYQSTIQPPKCILFEWTSTATESESIHIMAPWCNSKKTSVPHPDVEPSHMYGDFEKCAQKFHIAPVFLPSNMPCLTTISFAAKAHRFDTARSVVLSAIRVWKWGGDLRGLVIPVYPRLPEASARCHIGTASLDIQMRFSFYNWDYNKTNKSRFLFWLAEFQ